MGLPLFKPGVAPGTYSDDDDSEVSDDDDWGDDYGKVCGRKAFEDLVRIATNDPCTTVLSLASQATIEVEDINTLMMSVADALQGNTFLRTIRLTLDNQEHRWAHLKEEAFVRLLAAVQLQQSNVINFSLPSTSFFDILDVRGPGDADHPGKYDLAAAARIVTLGRAMASNRTEMIRKGLPDEYHVQHGMYRDDYLPGQAKPGCFGQFESSTEIVLVCVDGDVLTQLTEALASNSRARRVRIRDEMDCPVDITDVAVALLKFTVHQCNVIDMTFATLVTGYHYDDDGTGRAHPIGDCYAYSIFDNFGIHSGLPGNLSPSTRASLMRKCIANLVELVQDNDPSVVEIDWTHE